MMQASYKSSNSTKQSNNGDDNKSSDQVITMPIPGNLQESLSLMSYEQIISNIIEINLVSIYNEDILSKLYEWSVQTKFYLMNRYLLQSVINVGHHIVSTPKTKHSNKHKKELSEIVQKYDTIYVNGRTTQKMQKKDSSIMKHGLQKQVRAKFIGDRQQFVYQLQYLSQLLKTAEKQLNKEQLRNLFETKLDQINKSQLKTSLSSQKIDELKNSSVTSFDSNDSAISEISSVSSFDSPDKQKTINIFSMHYQGQIRWIKQIKKQKSSYIRTKNRYPLILNFDFARFIYKKDNQLSHQLIAMHLAKYLNRIISQKMASPQIVEYQIIPEASGAFYEFVQNSITIGEIKRSYSGGISEYLDYLEAKSYQSSDTKLSSIRKRFAQSFAGFCTLQYFLQLKDRNNENIMIRSDGSIFHIDLAFIFNSTPGGISFQSAPFKFPTDYLQALGGDFESDAFKYYQSLMISNFSRILINKDQFLHKLSIMSARKQQILCFKKFSLQNYNQKIPRKISRVQQSVQILISQSYDNWRTNRYDKYQFDTNKIPM